MNTDKKTASRKLDHLRICLEKNIERGDAGFDDIRLLHNAVPECSMNDIRLQTRFLGATLGSPIFISAMTGGHPGTLEINRTLARAAERYHLGMGVGSQRAAIENPSLSDTFSVVRDEAPHAFLVANLGVVQLKQHGIDWALEAIGMIHANALAIHLNFLQEAIQPEGDHDATGGLAALSAICRESPVPVIVKETGSGISYRTAILLASAGVRVIDTGGYGGTSWAAIEAVRAGESSRPADNRLTALGNDFSGWGIPTIVSLYAVRKAGVPVIASGGLRSGIDVARALAMGASLGGIALPLLKPASLGFDPLCETIEILHDQLRIAMFLTGSSHVQDLARAGYLVSGETRTLMKQIDRMEEKWK